eukprot:TRINITY_DN6878_c0_g1_i2.p1 TRINITY_DN6878_c0_g1~~TRINITY_DN6878_c0_g1_i2.p1  ORF type:complete len:595 (-),score=245.76 TRINITY_DN6878_c0_g1_i2:94-1878(-)
MRQKVPALDSLLKNLCPSKISEKNFWRAYFMLMQNKLGNILIDDVKEKNEVELPALPSIFSRMFLERRSLSDSENTQTERIFNTKDAPIWATNPNLSTRVIDFKDIRSAEKEIWDQLLVEHENQSEVQRLTMIDNRIYLRIKEQLRSGVCDGLRGRVWTSITGATRRLKEFPENYADSLQKVFGNHTPKTFCAVPTFGSPIEFTNANRYQLTLDGWRVVKRLLVTVAVQHEMLRYAPVLPDFIAITLHFITEIECWSMLQLMLRRLEQGRNTYFSTSCKSTAITMATLKTLISRFLPNLHEHLKSLQVDITIFATSWFNSLFTLALDFKYVLRIVDAYILQGERVLVRAGLALLQYFEDQLLTCDTQQDFILKLNTLVQSFNADAGILTRPFPFISYKELLEFEKASQYLITNVKEVEPNIYYHPDILTSSTIFTTEHFNQAWEWLPPRYRIREPYLVFNAAKDGFNLKTLYLKCENISPSILILKTKSNSIFGAFLSHPLRPCDTFIGNGECFIFTFDSQPKAFHWNQYSNKEFFFNPASRSLTIGGGQGTAIWLDDELLHGKTTWCQTFNNEPLQSNSDFECVTIEVFGLTD